MPPIGAAAPLRCHRKWESGGELVGREDLAGADGECEEREHEAQVHPRAGRDEETARETDRAAEK
jgi:hypothetical protein